MLEIEIPSQELYDESKNEFLNIEGRKLQLEHSLISISKWESKWKKPFLSKDKKTNEQLIDYINCMLLTKNVDKLLINNLPPDVLLEINSYIEDQQTATWFNDNDKGSSREIITSEVIYYQMFKCGIPKECEKWHLSRLITLIRVFAAKDGNSKKMSKDQIRRQNRELNEKRRAASKSKG